MEVLPLGVPGAWLFQPAIHRDPRGSFLELFSQSQLGRVLPKDQFPVQQINASISQRNVIRGVHCARRPPGQAKYVTCVSGSILDCIVDMRRESPTFGLSIAVELDDQSRNCLLLDAGLGHAFQVLSSAATVVYATSSAYDPSLEFGVNPLDVDLALPWVDREAAIMSARDANAPLWEEWVAAGDEGAAGPH